MRALEIVEVLPLLELGGEQRSVIYDHTLGQSEEVFVVDSMGAFDFAVEQGRRQLYVEVADPPIEHVPVKAGLEFGPDVGLIYQLRYACFTVFAWDITDDLAMFVARRVPPKSERLPERKLFA